MSKKVGFDYFVEFGYNNQSTGPEEYWDTILTSKQKTFWNKVAKLFNK